MKPSKTKATERMGIDPTDAILQQCRNLIWHKVGEKPPVFFTHSKKACKNCKHKFRCFTLK